MTLLIDPPSLKLACWFLGHLSLLFSSSYSGYFWVFLKLPHSPLPRVILRRQVRLGAKNGSFPSWHSLKKHVGICFLTQEPRCCVLNSSLYHGSHCLGPDMPLRVCIYNSRFEMLSQHLDICFFHLSPQKAVCFRKGHWQIRGHWESLRSSQKTMSYEKSLKELGPFCLEDIKLRDDRELISDIWRGRTLLWAAVSGWNWTNRISDREVGLNRKSSTLSIIFQTSKIQCETVLSTRSY